MTSDERTSLIGDLAQIKATLNQIEASVVAGFNAIHAGQDAVLAELVVFGLHLQNIANATVATANTSQQTVDKLAELISIVKGPPVVGIMIRPGTPTSH